MLNKIDILSIEGVQPKPAGLSASLKRVSTGDMRIQRDVLTSLQQRGFFFGPGGGLYSNEGEIVIHTSRAVTYTLRFGEIAADESGDKEKLKRYLFISAEFNPALMPAPEKPADMTIAPLADSLLTEAQVHQKRQVRAYQRWESQVVEAKAYGAEIGSRFEDWYYLITDEYYEKIALKRTSLIEKIEAK